ncbi:hypothetical protein DFP72DRAFT_1060356 [Ephemerocybe angulata]|uniref:DUF6533 domain-containing protein n=1 Tax=Ephemerocybe angulata TaxID=980116 RepID=A0A8H6IDQ0_9AGAR|nr:hypothetical protein DFP72DRAFT_1060356 [Tulosesus angulatus]
MSFLPGDEEKLLGFMKYAEMFPEAMAGYNRSAPIEGYIIIGCFVILTYDYIITFDQEVNYVWKSPWTIGLPLFYMNRYVPFIDVGLILGFPFHNMTEEQCNTQVQTATWIMLIPTFFGQTIIALRTCALWQNNISVVASMIMLMLSTLVVTCVLIAKQMNHMQFAPAPSFINGCHIMYDPFDTTLYLYVALFATELIIISLTIIKAWQHLRRNRTAWIYQLYKNGIFYCVCVVALSLMNIIVPTTNLPYVYKQCLRMPQHVLHSMFCNRVVLQILKHRVSIQESMRPRAGLNGRFTGDNDGTSTSGTNNILTSVHTSIGPTQTMSMRSDIELSVIDSRQSIGAGAESLESDPNWIK